MSIDRKPKFDDYHLADCPDKHGVTPKLGDFVRFTLYDGIENVVAQIQINKYGYHTPYLLKYLEFEIFDGVWGEDDVTMEEALLILTGNESKI